MMHDDETHMRRAIALAEDGERRGARPFGAVVVDRSGKVIGEGSSLDVADRRDWTAHAEMTALRVAAAQASWDDLAGATLYASAEPCPMCAAAAYWCNMGRVVFGAPEPEVQTLRAGHPRAAGLAMGVREVLATSPRPIDVEGPVLEDEALAAHRRYWAKAPRGV